MSSPSMGLTVVVALCTSVFWKTGTHAAESETQKSPQTKGCLIQTIYKLADKSTYTAQHCVSGQEKCHARVNGYCFDYGIVDPSITSKTCTPVDLCPAKPELK